jgi:hypothetical protein
MSGWIKLNPDLEQHQLVFIINKTKRNIKARLTNIANKTGIYQKESIVVISTGDITNDRKIKNYQYINIDITLFNKPGNIYDRNYTKAFAHSLTQEIIINDLIDDQVFNFLGGDIRASGQYSMHE